MLLLTFLLIPNIVVATTKIVGGYAIILQDNVLTDVLPYPLRNNNPNDNLNLSRQNIISIGRDAFYNTPYIKTLDLSNNNISTLGAGALLGLEKLTHLSLAKNPLTDFRKAFQGLKRLQSLDISNTSVRHLGPSYFFGIPKTTNIRTSGDKLETISRALFTKTYVSDFARALLCQNEGIVSSLQRWPHSMLIPAGCTRMEIDSMNWIRLNQSGISGFESNWYRLYERKLDGLDLHGNNIVHLTSELFSSLPHSLKSIDLSKNKIERVPKELHIPRNLKWLSLSNNLINKVENNAFENTNLASLKLDSNRLNDLRFVESVRRNLLRLDLQNNQLSEQQLYHSFVKLTKLINLDLAQNQITELTRTHFVGLESLLTLNLQGNGLKHMDSDCFEHIPNVKEINLSNNDLMNLEHDTFYFTKHIEILDLSHNNLSTLPRFGFCYLKKCGRLNLGYNALTNLDRAFVNLSSIQHLDISYNPITSVKKEDFDGVPKTVNILSEGNTLSSTTIKDEMSKLFFPWGDREGDAPILLCMNESTVTAVRHMTVEDDPIPKECRKIELKTDWFPETGYTILDLSWKQISKFAKNWYRLRVPVNTIFLMVNKIVDVTSEMFNDLPKSVICVHLTDNPIKRLKKGVIVNKHLKYLGLYSNHISEIEEDALVNTNLTVVDLSNNSLEGLQFVAHMPRTLLELYVGNNDIRTVSAGAFSHLSELKYLHLDYSKINNIERGAFRGLSSLKILSLNGNLLKTINKFAFRDTPELADLKLERNKLERLDKHIFDGLTKLSHVSLMANQFRNVTIDSLPYFPDSLRYLNLEKNRMYNIEPGSFVGGLKYELSLQYNYLKTINKDVFKLPNLVILLLGNNTINQVNGEAFNGMPNLEELYLNDNQLTKIDEGTAKYLNKLYVLDISHNPITKLQNAIFSSLSNFPNQKYEAIISVAKTRIEHIHGNLFDDV